jgi:SAM-dependent methyltransferase
MSDTGIYFIDGDVIAESGNVKVYRTDYDLFLEVGPGHTLWALGSEIEDYEKQLGNAPFGNVLEIGLGLGIASKFFLTCQKVKTLTTIEINSDVIVVYKQLSLFNTTKNHEIINNDGLSFVTSTEKKYDFIFMDYYTLLDEETLPEIEELVKVCKRVLKPVGKIAGWYDKFTPEEFTKRFNEIFGCDMTSE